ncbi:MAG TPA: type II toxin-antitoxin system PemK/MazF family toxin [Bryobacteraceae bacterium]|jgi:mRNA-degrading endonuclease toxin of MazEF toxin-antitoxin module|nr:type II toxin-antitoxin system PemK/MazF family toxin [Bryobacteraceae bacterium]
MEIGYVASIPVGSHEGLSKHCVVNCDNLRTIAKSCLIRKLGAISLGRYSEIKRAIGYAFGWQELIDVI